MHVVRAGASVVMSVVVLTYVLMPGGSNGVARDPYRLVLRALVIPTLALILAAFACLAQQESRQRPVVLSTAVILGIAAFGVLLPPLG